MRTAASSIRVVRSQSNTRPWTPAMIAFLTRHRRAGRTLRWIAKALDVPLEQVRTKAVSLGLVLRSVYQVRVLAVQMEAEPAPCGAPRELLDEGNCRWIAGDVGDPDWRMCGHPTKLGSSWCEHHHARAFWLAEPCEGGAA